MSLRIVFAGTPEFSVPSLQALIDSEHQVLAVYTQPDRPFGRGQHLHKSPVKQLAEQYDIPIHQPKSWKIQDVADQLSAYCPDVIVVVAYGMLVPQNILDLPKFGCINVHASLLPRWRGAAPIQYAIKSGDDLTGVTIMQMNAHLDRGDILATREVQLGFHETAQHLHDSLAKLGPPALLEVLAQCEAGTLNPQFQDEGMSTYADKLTKNEARVDWNLPSAPIERMVRAFNPWPVAFTTVHDQDMKIWSSEVVHEHKSNHVPGTIISATEQGIEVATGDGILRILEVQFPGGKRLPVADVLHSKQDWFKPGTVL